MSPTDTATVTRARADDRPRRRHVLRLSYRAKVSIATGVALIAIWWVLARLAVVPAMFLPGPFAVLAKLADVSTDGFQGATLWDHLVASLMRVSVALTAAFATGVALGFAMALSETAKGICRSPIEMSPGSPLEMTQSSLPGVALKVTANDGDHDEPQGADAPPDFDRPGGWPDRC